MIVETPTYVVNLPRRRDRRARMAKRLADFRSVIYTSDWNRDYDGQRQHELLGDHPHVTLAQWQDPSSPNPWYSRPLKWGEVGCALAHIACWTHFVCSGAPEAIFLEDDADPQPHFVANLEQALGVARLASFDLLYLGRVPQAQDRGAHGDLVVPGYSHCTYGYVLSSAGATATLRLEPWRDLIPIDEFLPATYIRHPRADVAARFGAGIRALACTPDIVLQDPKDEMGSDTELSEFATSPEVRPTSRLGAD